MSSDNNTNRGTAGQVLENQRIRELFADVPTAATATQNGKKRHAYGKQGGRDEPEIFNLCGGRCYYCGVALSQETWQIEHFIPRSRGGSKDRANLVPSCRGCNKQKSSLVPEEFKYYLVGRMSNTLANVLSMAHKWSFTLHPKIAELLSTSAAQIEHEMRWAGAWFSFYGESLDPDGYWARHQTWEEYTGDVCPRVTGRQDTGVQGIRPCIPIPSFPNIHNTQVSNTHSDSSKELSSFFEGSAEAGPDGPTRKSAFKLTPPDTKMGRSRRPHQYNGPPIPSYAWPKMYEICYCMTTPDLTRLASKAMRERVAAALSLLVRSGADLSRLGEFSRWWRNWAKSYPTPEQVAGYWAKAMTEIDTAPKPTPVKVVFEYSPPPREVDPLDLLSPEERMARLQEWDRRLAHGEIG